MRDSRYSGTHVQGLFRSLLRRTRRLTSWASDSPRRGIRSPKSFPHHAVAAILRANPGMERLEPRLLLAADLVLDLEFLSSGTSDTLVLAAGEPGHLILTGDNIAPQTFQSPTESSISLPDAGQRCRHPRIGGFRHTADR